MKVESGLILKYCANLQFLEKFLQILWGSSLVKMRREPLRWVTFWNRFISSSSPLISVLTQFASHHYFIQFWKPQTHQKPPLVSLVSDRASTPASLVYPLQGNLFPSLSHFANFQGLQSFMARQSFLVVLTTSVHHQGLMSKWQRLLETHSGCPQPGRMAEPRSNIAIKGYSKGFPEMTSYMVLKALQTLGLALFLQIWWYLKGCPLTNPKEPFHPQNFHVVSSLLS